MQTVRSNRSFARYAWCVLAYNVAVILWGAFVRATGSGAGCGQHWPLCNGDIVPVAPALETIIEFTHRVTSGIDLALVALLVFWGFRAFPRRHPVRLGVVLSSIFLMTEALVGAALVLAGDQSLPRKYSILSLHLINTLTLLACLALTAWWGMGRPRVRLAGRAAWLAAGSLGMVVILGVSGAIAAFGDSLFPSRSLSEGFARDFDPASSVFIRLRVLHPLFAALAGLWLVLYGATIAGRRPDLRSSAWLVLGLVVAQLAAGLTNLLLRAPTWMQILHLALADALWIALVLLCAGVLKSEEITADKEV